MEAGPDRTRAHQEARDVLPEELQPIFDELVEYYKYATIKHFGRGYVAYNVIAELVLAGWRPSAEPRPELPVKRARKPASET